MKNIIAITVLSVMVFIGSYAFLDALDRSIYPDCKVLEQKGDTLYISLSKDLLIGTDSSCESAERLVDRIKRDGYQVKVVMPYGEWSPLPKITVYK